MWKKYVVYTFSVYIQVWIGFLQLILFLDRPKDLKCLLYENLAVVPQSSVINPRTTLCCVASCSITELPLHSILTPSDVQMFAHMFIFPTDLVLLKLLFQVQVVRPMTIGGSPVATQTGPPRSSQFWWWTSPNWLKPFKSKIKGSRKIQ